MRFALIGYPSEQQGSFLSFTEQRSKYTLGIGGRFRMIDFMLSMAARVDIRHIFLYQNREEEQLQQFLQNYLITSDVMRLHLLQRGLHQFFLDTQKIIRTSRIDAIILYKADNPLVFDMQEIADRFIQSSKPAVLFSIESLPNLGIKSKKPNPQVLLAKRETFITLMNRVLQDGEHEEADFDRLIDRCHLDAVSSMKAEGFYDVLGSVRDYYSFNMKILENRELIEPYLTKMEIGSFMPVKGSTEIGKTGVVYNSIISENCQIDGSVVDSILFPGVVIGKEAKIVGSVILPNNIIGKFASVFHAIVEETNPSKERRQVANIGDYCIVGRVADNLETNAEYPSILSDGLTVIGRNCAIPRKVKIGGNCFISPMTNQLKIKMYNRVADGVVV